MKARSIHYFTRLHSYADAVATVEALKARGFNVKAYGRMRDKRKTFQNNGLRYGRFYGNAVNFDNDVRLSSPIAQYAYAWAIYVYPKKVRVKKVKPTIEFDETQLDAFSTLPSLAPEPVVENTIPIFGGMFVPGPLPEQFVLDTPDSRPKFPVTAEEEKASFTEQVPT